MNIEEIKNKLKEKGMDFIILKIDNKIASSSILKNNLVIENFINEEDLLNYIK